MPRSLVRVDADLIYPPATRAFLDLIGVLSDRQELFAWTYGFRSIAVSDAMSTAYKAGKGPRAAPGGKSAHNFGLAADFSRVTGGVYDPKPAKYEDLLGPVAEEIGLAWGGHYGDAPHCNWPGFTSGGELAPLLALWKSSPGLTDSEKLGHIWSTVDSICATPEWRDKNPKLAKYL